MVWIWGLFCFFWIQYTYAQTDSPPDSVTIESVQIGYSGYGHYSRWLPIGVQIKSILDYPVHAQIEVSGSSSNTLKVVKEFELPARGTSSFSITPVAMSYPTASSLTFRLKVNAIGLDKIHRESGGNLLLNYGDFLIGVLAKRGSELSSKDFRYLSEQLLIKKQTIQFADIVPEELSNNWSLYQTIDCLILPDISQLSLLSPHQEALLDWIASGGNLLINGGDRALGLSQSFLQPALSFDITTQQKILTGAENEFFKYFVKPRLIEKSNSQEKILMMLPRSKTETLGYKILAQTESSEPLPLLLEQKYGNGKIFFSTVDLTQEPFKQNVLLLKFLVEHPEIAKKHWTTIEQSKQTLFEYLLPFFHMKSGTFWIIFLFLLTYIVSIAFCHRQFAKKEKSLEFKIKLLPRNALLFSGIALVLTQIIVPPQVFQEIQILHHLENSPVAIRETMAIFQPARTGSVEILPQNSGYLDSIELFEFDPSKQNSIQLRRSDIFLEDCEQGILRHWRWISLLRPSERLQIRLEPEFRDLKTGEVQSFHLEITNLGTQPFQNLYLVGRECFVPLTSRLDAGKSLVRSGISSRQELLHPHTDFFFPRLATKDQQDIFAQTFWRESLNTMSRDPKDNVFYHIIGFVELPSAFKLTSSGQPLTFDSQKIWGMVRYQFSFPPTLFIKTVPAEENPISEEEKDK